MTIYAPFESAPCPFQCQVTEIERAKEVGAGTGMRQNLFHFKPCCVFVLAMDSDSAGRTLQA